MSNYAIMRFAKYKAGSVANVERHQTRRDRLTHRKHPERECLNRTFKQFPEETMTRTVRRMIKEQEERTGRKLRKDAVVLTEFVLTFSPEMETVINKKKWCKANRRWIEATFGKDAVLRIDDNRDESTFHQHFFLILRDDKGNINASHFFGKKKQVIDLQDSYAEAMRPFGLVRGESKEKTRARHQTLQEWKKTEQKKLEAEIKDIEQKEREVWNGSGYKLSADMADFIVSTGQEELFADYQREQQTVDRYQER